MNVVLLEEDIKILENFLNIKILYGRMALTSPQVDILKHAITNLINKNKELRQEVAEHERREGQQNQNMVSALEESLKYSLEIKDLEIKNKELEKMVELMAKDIAENDIEDICKIVGDDPHCTEYTEEDKCVECTINYFKKKANEENE